MFGWMDGWIDKVYFLTKTTQTKTLKSFPGSRQLTINEANVYSMYSEADVSVY